MEELAQKGQKKMGQLILCHPYTAQNPYTIAITGAKVYAIEELCYYLCENLYLIDDSILDLQLCKWIGTELRLKELDFKLRECLQKKATRTDFVETILKDSGYCDEKELYQIRQVLNQMMEKSEKERKKIRADRLLKNKKYALAMQEYRKLLSKKEKTLSAKEERKLNGNIWHNIGIIYANLFLFEQAEECFETAYSLNYSGQSFEAQTRAKEYADGHTGITEHEKEEVYQRFQEKMPPGKNEGERTQLKKMLEILFTEYKKMYGR